MAVGREGVIAAGLGLVRLKVWNGLSFLFGGRRAVWYGITDRRVTHPEEFKADMAALFDLLREGAIHPVVVDRLPIAAARDGHRAGWTQTFGKLDALVGLAETAHCRRKRLRQKHPAEAGGGSGGQDQRVTAHRRRRSQRTE